MSVTARARHWVGSRGLNRSALLRRLIRVGHPRLRELRARALSGRDPGSLAMRSAIRWLESGVLRIPQGHAGGIALDMRYLPISHAHFGSLAFGNLESSVQEAMLRHLGKGGVFYDIGANLGFFSLLGAHLAGVSDGWVYAFEAAPDNASAIRSNAELNGLANIVVIDKAVSAHGGRGRLQIVDDQSWSKLEEYGDHPNTEQVIEVELVAIDDLLAVGELRPPTLVKIDVEGAEIAVLEGMRATIERHRPAIVCELHGTHHEFAEAMTAHGYRVINLEGTIPVTEEGASAHALALPPLDPGD
ncbi:MAG: FkbM family methyltransferase [Actinomycetota bacterium]|nr:FkbM family methyltransferase [Actinomycetota bacterium]